MAKYPYTDPNPLCSDVIITGLKNDFFSVDYQYKDGAELNWAVELNDDKIESYGGYQGWFGKYGTLSNEKIFCNNNVSGAEIHSYGCGIIALTDMLVYMAIGDGSYNPTALRSAETIVGIPSNYSHFNFGVYIACGFYVSQYFTGYLPIFKGVAGDGIFLSNLENALKLISINNNMNLKKIMWQYDSNSSSFISKMKYMLNDDIPVIISYNVLSEGNEIQLYTFDNELGFQKNGPNINSHFLDATSILEFSLDTAKLVGHETMIKVGTYGKEFYIDFKQYCPRLGFTTNMLYVEK